MAEAVTFISSPFSTRAEYEAWLALPAAEREATLARARDERGPLSIDGLAEALPSTASWGPMEFPAVRRADIAATFQSKADDGKLSIKEAWKIVFTESERSEYDFDSFDTDLQATCDNCKDDMSWDDVLKFLDENL